MRALTLCQPHAHFVAWCGKRAENRSWHTAYRGPLAVHAGLSRSWLVYDEDDEGSAPPLPDGTPYPRLGDMAWGAVVAVAELVDCRQPSEVNDLFLPDPVRAALRSHWAEGSYCFILAGVRPLPRPVPCRGAMGLWRLPPDVERAVLTQLASAEGVTP
jgi:hypothetical protein